MKNRFKNGINYGAVILAICSFLIGTIVLLSYKITNAEPLLIFGLYYTILAAVVNTIVLLVLVINTILNYRDYLENSITILILLANIPITYWYMELAFSIESFF